MSDIRKASKRAITEAMNAATDEIDAWRRDQLEALKARDLSPDEFTKAKLALMVEVGRRAKRAEGRAKYQNSPRKLFERGEIDVHAGHRLRRG